MRRLPLSLASTTNLTRKTAAVTVGSRGGSRLVDPLKWNCPAQGSASLFRNFLTALAPLFSRPPSSPAPFSATDRRLEDAGLAFSPSSLDSSSTIDISALSHLPFRFDTGVALFAKRAPRPFPPPFLSPPSGSFSDPLSTHHRSRIDLGGGGRHRNTFVDGQLIQGWTNGDDAVFANDFLICANDGVGAWSARPRGHAGLWARLILHFWATSIFDDAARHGKLYRPDSLRHLQKAYEKTLEATKAPNDWQGTTTSCGALLHYYHLADDNVSHATAASSLAPLLYVTNLGDSQVMVVRPAGRELVYKSAEQWHWFDCPRQLGTNSPDTPQMNAAVDTVAICEGDVVLAMSDGVTDNLWPHEIVTCVSDSLAKWNSGQGVVAARPGRPQRMAFVAQELMEAAKIVALDRSAESPYMERAIEEGLPSEGGKLDDISVVAALCRRNDG